VISDKPLTRTLSEADDLVARVARSGLPFAVTYNYTGYPMVRQARAMIAAGDLGELRTIQVEYAQGWLSTDLESTGQKQAAWRTDPARSGAGGAIGDIGTHAFNLAEFITGLRCQHVAADLSSFVPGRRVDDNAHMLLRFENGAKGMLWASQVAPGYANGLRIRIHGSRASLAWAQEAPESLVYATLDAAPARIIRGGPTAGAAAAHATRIPAGHPEGYLEAFAQLYRDFAAQLRARLAGSAPPPDSLLVPGVHEGARGVAFVAAAVTSSAARARWTCSFLKKEPKNFPYLKLMSVVRPAGPSADEAVGHGETDADLRLRHIRGQWRHMGRAQHRQHGVIQRAEPGAMQQVHL
jgi:predicted dehydrogenase